MAAPLRPAGNVGLPYPPEFNFQVTYTGDLDGCLAVYERADVLKTLQANVSASTGNNRGASVTVTAQSGRIEDAFDDLQDVHQTARSRGVAPTPER